jgi:hypothetical protein
MPSKSRSHKGAHRLGGATVRRPGTVPGRCTPPTPPAFRVRPSWHRIIGVLVVVAGGALLFICQFNGWGIHDYGGHIWYLVGGLIAGSGLWWFGMFEKETVWA